MNQVLLAHPCEARPLFQPAWQITSLLCGQPVLTIQILTNHLADKLLKCDGELCDEPLGLEIKQNSF